MMEAVIPLPANAVSLGAKTVKGPVSFNVVAKLAFTTAVFNKLKFALFETMVVMVCGLVDGLFELFLQAVPTIITADANKPNATVFFNNKFFITVTFCLIFITLISNNSYPTITELYILMAELFFLSKFSQLNTQKM